MPCTALFRSEVRATKRTKKRTSTRRRGGAEKGKEEEPGQGVRRKHLRLPVVERGGSRETRIGCQRDEFVASVPVTDITPAKKWRRGFRSRLKPRRHFFAGV